MPSGRPVGTGRPARAPQPYGVLPNSPRPVSANSAGEASLMAYAERLAAARGGQRAIVFHLSRLHRSHRTEKLIETAAGMLQELAQEFGGRLFVEPAGDLVVICKGVTSRAMDEAIEAVRYLFVDDPLAGEGAQAEFSSLFDLEIAYPHFMSMLRQMRDGTLRPVRRVPSQTGGGARPALSQLLDPGRVAALIDRVNAIDLTRMVRRQTIWAMPAGQPPQAKFEELFVSIEALKRSVGPDFQLATDPHLFQYLTRWLDRSLIDRLVWEKFSNGRPLSININLATLQSLEFAELEVHRTGGWRGRIILEVQLFDAWSDLPAYLAAADLMKERGYLRCIDGLTHQALTCVNFHNLKADLVKLAWDDSLLQLDEAALRELYRAIAECGPRRIILTRCGREEALRFGQAIGIHLFQGWHLDRLTAPKPHLLS